MWTKIVIVVLLLAIAASLFSALRMMSRNAPADRRKMARYLTLRVSLSVFLLLVLSVAMYMGWITPHGIQSIPPDASIQRQ